MNLIEQPLVLPTLESVPSPAHGLTHMEHLRRSVAMWSFHSNLRKPERPAYPFIIRAGIILDILCVGALHLQKMPI